MICLILVIQIEEINDKVNIFRSKIGMFIIVDYYTENGLDSAKGILKKVSDNGDVHIEHTAGNEISWGINIHQMKHYKFYPLRGGGEN